jgi:outer membrane protein OmpA-like peptidoglycan-associated protein
MKIYSLAPALAISTIVAGIGSSQLYAQSSGELDGSFPKRFYLGLGGGNARLEPDTTGTLFVPADSTDKGGKAFLGWDFSRRLTLELQFADLGTASLQNEETLEVVGIEYSEISLSGLYYLWNDYADDDFLDYNGLDLRSGFSFYGRLGAGQMENETSGNVSYSRENDIQVLVGLGMEYGFRNGLAARLEHIKFDTDAEYTGASVLYRFGGVDEAQIGGVSNEPELPVLPAPKPILPPPPPPTPEVIPELPELPEVVEPAAGDSDQDGVANDTDLCPDTAAGTPVNSEGCEMFNGVVEGVNFLTGSDTLTAVARATLDEVVLTLQEFPDITLSVQAHTDNQGDETDNLELSRRRALSVVRYLIAQGISIDRLQARAYGESRPIADNTSAEGRLINRRVEFRTIQ